MARDLTSPEALAAAATTAARNLAEAAESIRVSEGALALLVEHGWTTGGQESAAFSGAFAAALKTAEAALEIANAMASARWPGRRLGLTSGTEAPPDARLIVDGCRDARRGLDALWALNDVLVLQTDRESGRFED